ncbi:glycosyltransferase [Brevundimonas sp. S30B]|uniref:glycosyltransferase family 2 protein n=1 Tax=unclassified Brevundimonas TaxID=2622653 RepID=UPI001071C863|nr:MULTISPECIES: glycosyltransferase [unclassified Brevundimonas]QBX38497.1 glycosyltransferase [Brevundimonas sp. MF30-B]TFW02205.1 glycosyltransferase [Brevundimonas sp. S30B]
MSADIHDSPAWAGAAPRLSVLTPFLRDDPRDLLGRLLAEPTDGAVEIVLLDDGTNDPALTAGLKALIDGGAIPVRLITLPANEGRARGRNRLTLAARGRHFLFLDSDMRPDRPDFLHAWLDVAAKDPPAVFGGFTLEQAPDDARFAVHRAMAGRTDCLSAAERSRDPGKHVFTSNLLVRRDVFEAEAFDPGFTGWGWEDVEWGLRVTARYGMGHADVPATHMGLDTVPALAAKYEQSAGNFARLAALHPQAVAAYPSHKVARIIRRLPGRGLLRRASRAVAGAEAAPVPARAFALRLYRAALYAEALR